MLDRNEMIRKIKTGDKVKISYQDSYMEERGLAPEELPWTTVYEIDGWWYTVGVCLANGSVVKILDWKPSPPAWAKARVIEVPGDARKSYYLLRNEEGEFVSVFGVVYSVQDLVELGSPIRVIVGENDNVISEN